MYIIELDQESKGSRSIFVEPPILYEEHRKTVVVKRELKTSFFHKERNISQGLRKHGALLDFE